jgi:hypothetical protein
MPRGSKPGERRGGRQRATPNKRTALTDRILAVVSTNPIASCDELVAILVKDQELPALSRMAIARQWFAAAHSRAAKGRSATGNAAAARRYRATGRPTRLKSDRGSARIPSPSTTGASRTASPTTNLVMLPILLSIVREEATRPGERRKAARSTSCPKNTPVRSQTAASPLLIDMVSSSMRGSCAMPSWSSLASQREGSGLTRSRQEPPSCRLA